MTERPLFPPKALCICGCSGADHRVVWDGDVFKGTRCDTHGGHKFAFAFVEHQPELEAERHAQREAGAWPE